MMDSHGRNIDYLRVSLTDRCNLRCVYCMPEEGVPSIEHHRILRLEETSKLVRIIDSVLSLRKIRVTGGEPLVRRGVVSIVEELSSIAEVTMTTNGILLPEFAAPLAEAGLSRVNISVDSLDDSVLRRVTRRNVSVTDIENAVRAALDNGLGPVKLNCVVLSGVNTGELAGMVRWAGEHGAVIRFIEHMPMEGSVCGYTSGEEILQEISGELGRLRKMGRSGTAEMFETSQGLRFGLIAPVGSDICRFCTRLRLTADGMLLPCLAGGEPLDAGAMLRKGIADREIADAVRELTLSKPGSGNCGGVRMWRIGG